MTDATFLERYGFLSVEVFIAVLKELAEQLHGIDSCLKNSDTFDLAGFHGDVASVVATAPSSDPELRALKETLDREAKERLAAMDPWERLGVEWDEYHRAARRLLDDPFFWDGVYDFAPHGNDTGADLLSDFRKWNKVNPLHPAHEMVRKFLDNWGIARIDLQCADESVVRSMYQQDGDSLTVSDDAMIAVAFAAVKLRGCCDRETRELALRAMERERLVAIIAEPAWKHAAERIIRLDQMAAVLARIPECVPSE